MEENKNLTKLKKTYSVFKKKYSLPDFDELNKDFHIEKICEEETDFLLREIRRYLGEKITNYVKLIESILHPVNSSVFIFSIIKALSEGEKEEFQKIYDDLAKIQIKLIKLDTKYSEKSEADFIRDFCYLWRKTKSKIYNLFSSIENNFGNNISVDSKGYFG